MDASRLPPEAAGARARTLRVSRPKQQGTHGSFAFRYDPLCIPHGSFAEVSIVCSTRVKLPVNTE